MSSIQRSFEFELDRIDIAASELLKVCSSHFFFGFYGEMGTGKTTLIGELCRALGSKDIIQSPTYSIVNEYLLCSKSKKRIYHMDLYRLEDERELLDMGIEYYLDDSSAFIFVEWPQIMEAWFPDNAVKVQLANTESPQRRLLTIEF